MVGAAFYGVPLGVSPHVSETIVQLLTMFCYNDDVTR